MSGGHGHAHGLYMSGDSPVHRLPAHWKLAATLAFVLAVVATPREAPWAFALDAVLVVVVARIATIPLGRLARRLTIEAPFLAFALFLPLVGEGREVEVLGVGLSASGLWAAWNIVVKGTLGVAATVVLASTTTVPELLTGLDRLHAPRALTTVAGFMIRYGEVVTGEMRRMRVARLSRGHDPRWLWQARAVGSSAAALFIRSYERGERVHLAMLSRGFAGGMPKLAPSSTQNVENGAGFAAVAVAAVPALAALAAATAWGLR